MDKNYTLLIFNNFNKVIQIHLKNERKRTKGRITHYPLRSPSVPMIELPRVKLPTLILLMILSPSVGLPRVRLPRDNPSPPPPFQAIVH